MLPIVGRDGAAAQKKERPGYQWGSRWGADDSSSPAFAWGQRLGLGGGDCQRNISKSKVCAFKKSRQYDGDPT